MYEISGEEEGEGEREGEGGREGEGEDEGETAGETSGDGGVSPPAQAEKAKSSRHIAGKII